MRAFIGNLPQHLKTVTFVGLVAAFVAVTLSIDAWGAYNLSSSRWVMAIFVTIAVAGGIYKCFAFTTIRAAWRDKHWGRWLMLCVLLLVAWAQSSIFELTFYSQLYGDAAMSRQSEVDITSDRKKEKIEIEDRLAKRATNRTTGEIAAEIERALAKPLDGRLTLGQLTKGCTAKQRYDYRHCAPVLTLQSELEAAKKIAADEARLAEIRNDGAWVTRVGEAHSGASMIARTVKRVTGSAIEAAFVLDMFMLLGLVVVQLFSTLLPYAVFPYRPRPAIVVDAKLEGKVSGRADGAEAVSAKMNGKAVATAPGSVLGPSANADAPNDKPVGMSAGLGTVASVDGGAKPPLRISPFFSTADGGVSPRALLAPKGIIGPDDIGAFVAQYVEFGGKGFALASDLYLAYTGVVGVGLAHNAQAFLKLLRKSFPEGVKRRKTNGVIRFYGIQLNAAGQQVLNELRKEKHTLRIAA